MERFPLTVSTKDDDGNVPLHFARNGEVVRMLLDHPYADVNVSGQDNLTPLHSVVMCDQASGHERIAAVKALLEGKANVNATDASLGTALHAAAKLDFGRGGMFITQALLEAKANVDAADCHGRTALTYSVGRYEITDLLVTAGANITLEDTGGKTALQWYKATDTTGATATLRLLGEDNESDTTSTDGDNSVVDMVIDLTDNISIDQSPTGLSSPSPEVTACDVGGGTADGSGVRLVAELPLPSGGVSCVGRRR